MRMKRIVRRSLAIVVGLALGWIAAGVAMNSGVSATLASDEAPAEAKPVPASEEPAVVPHSDAPAGEKPHAVKAQEHPAGPVAHPSDNHENHNAHAEGHDPAIVAMQSLKPTPDQIFWYPNVLLAIAGLFLAAVTIGMISLKIRGPLPPDPADTHDDHTHDDHGHGHDAHGHDKDAHGHAHGKDDHAKPAGGGHH